MTFRHCSTERMESIEHVRIQNWVYKCKRAERREEAQLTPVKRNAEDVRSAQATHRRKPAGYVSTNMMAARSGRARYSNGNAPNRQLADSCTNSRCAGEERRTQARKETRCQPLEAGQRKPPSRVGG